MKRVLVTGATGYVGGRLVQELLLGDFEVTVMVRDRRKLSDQSWYNKVKIATASAGNKDELELALKDIDIAYFFNTFI